MLSVLAFGHKEWTSMANCVGTSPLLLPVSSRSQSQEHVKRTRPNIVGLKPLPYNIRKELKIATLQSSSPRIRCAAASNAKCTAASVATQTVTRNARTITVTPDKVKTPKLDDNGPGLPPRDDDGNGGNGGGGGKYSGGLTLLGILGILDILKDIEGEWQRKGRIVHRELED